VTECLLPWPNRQGFSTSPIQQKSMISLPINLSLAEEVVTRIPEDSWEDVRTSIVTYIVDLMPNTVLLQLTDSEDDFDRAEQILFDYYELPERKLDLIVDAFKIIGEENTLYLLDSMQLDKIQSKTNEVPEV
jgi:hypothetical protein